MASLHRLLEPKQSLPQRLHSPSPDRSAGGRNRWIGIAQLYGRLLMIQPETIEQIRPSQNNIHDGLRALLLSGHAILSQEYGSNLLATNEQDVRFVNRVVHGGVCG